jgi:hypothetical protein
MLTDDNDCELVLRYMVVMNEKKVSLLNDKMKKNIEKRMNERKV